MMRLDLEDIELTDEQIKNIQEKYTKKINDALDEVDTKELAKEMKKYIINDIENYLFDNVDLSECWQELSKFAAKTIKTALGGGKNNGRN